MMAIKQPNNMYQRRSRRVPCGSVPLVLPEHDEQLPQDCALETVQNWLHQRVDQQIEEARQKIDQFPAEERNIFRFTFSVAATSWPDESPASIVICGHRLETDAEYNRRIKAYEAKQKREAQKKKKQRETELKLLAELKAKYTEEQP